MFGFLKKSPSVPAALPALHWDLHAHLLPGVDDGVRSLDEALEGVRALLELGYRGCVLTPHIYKGVFDNSPSRLQEVFEQLKTAIAGQGLDFDLRLAAEYFADEHLLAVLAADDVLSFEAAGRCVLIEFSCFHEPPVWSAVLSALVKQGYQPVIAHPERYRFMAADKNTWLARFADYGAWYQGDIGSLAGQYGKPVAQLAASLLQADIYSFWGSDLHRPSQAERFIRPGLGHLTRLQQINKTLAKMGEMHAVS